MNRAFAAFAGLALTASVASAEFIGIDIREDKDNAAAQAATGVPDLRVFNLYAVFDGAGAAKTDPVLGKNVVLNVTTRLGINKRIAGTPPGDPKNKNLNARFYNDATGQADLPPNPAFLPVFPELAFDTFVTLNGKTGPPAGLSLDNDWNTDNGNTTGFHDGNGDGLQDSMFGGWFNSSPPNLLGAADANGDTLLAQLAVTGLDLGADLGGPDGNGGWISGPNGIFEGVMTIFRQGIVGEGETDAVPLTVFLGKVPTPGALALFGVAGLAGLRRRR